MKHKKEGGSKKLKLTKRSKTKARKKKFSWNAPIGSIIRSGKIFV